MSSTIITVPIKDLPTASPAATNLFVHDTSDVTHKAQLSDLWALFCGSDVTKSDIDSIFN